MALLDLQTMESDEHTGGGGGNSTLSLLSCVSAASITLCL
ncbi:SapB/AmfS family lanthipeptide [Streptomyces sp. NPDC048420]